MAMILEAAGMLSPLRPSGKPVPSMRSFWWRMISVMPWDERAGDGVDPPHHAVVLMGAATIWPGEADSVRVVDHDHRVVALGKLDDLGERRQVAVHRENAVSRNQAEP